MAPCYNLTKYHGEYGTLYRIGDAEFMLLKGRSLETEQSIRTSFECEGDKIFRRELFHTSLAANFALESLYNPPLHAHTYEVMELLHNPLKETPMKAVVKIKAAGLTPRQMAVILEKFRGRKWVLDCNRTWTLDMFKRLGYTDEIWYVEDPVARFEDLSRFFQETGLHFGMDETLAEHSFKTLSQLQGLTHFIIKPSLFGSSLQIRPWIDFAKNHNIDVILSSSMEGKCGIDQIIALHQRLGLTTPLGIDTLKYANYENARFEPVLSVTETMVQSHCPY